MAWAVGEILTAANLNTYLPQSSTTWTPSWTNLTLGNGTQVARYSRHGAWISLQLTLTFGSTTSVGGTISLTGLPTNPSFGSAGSLAMLDSSASLRYTGGVQVNAASGSILLINSPSGGLNATTPFTWATSDTIAFEVTYLVG